MTVSTQIFPTIYLAGHIQQDQYREAAQNALERAGCKVLNPFRESHDLRGKEEGAYAQIVRWDLQDVVECSGVLANFTDMSVGTSMECWFAHSIGRPVFPFVEESKRISPWIEYIAHRNCVFPSLATALEQIAEIWEL